MKKPQYPALPTCRIPSFLLREIIFAKTKVREIEQAVLILVAEQLN
jgi:hypothetical protein